MTKIEPNARNPNSRFICSLSSPERTQGIKQALRGGLLAGKLATYNDLVVLNTGVESRVERV